MTALKTLIFTMMVPGTVTVFIPYWLVQQDIRWFSLDIGAVRFLGVLLILAGAATYLWCAWDFTFTGRGTPAPIDPPKELVVKGLYSYVRNPMYVGVLLILLGEALLFESVVVLLYALLLLSASHLFVVFYEEPTLARMFGSSYERYRRSVRRWLPRALMKEKE